MSDPDRGAYTPPTDAPLTFDARRPVRGGGPRRSTLMISALVLVAWSPAIVVFWLYKDVRQARGRRAAAGRPPWPPPRAPPPVRGPARGREPPGLQIYQSSEDAAAEAEPTFAPPEPEQPRPPPARPPIVVTAAAQADPAGRFRRR
jgi:hypothetical protein